MAAGLIHAVPGGGESSDSDDDWYIGDHRERKEQIKKPLVSESNEDLLKNALVVGNAKLVKELLDSGLSVECCFQFGWTPLMFAASIGNFEMVRILLDRGANANCERDLFTALMAACTAHTAEENIQKCVELLLSRNVDTNACCRKKITALMLASREGHTQVVTLLIAHGADINAQDGNGYTALTWAAHDGRKNTVLKLLELGADKTIKNKSGNLPADVAKKNNDLAIFSILSFSGNLNQRCNLTKEEAMYRYLKTQPGSSANTTLSCSASSDLEVFLHGLGLGHLADIFLESDITLRQLLTLEEGDLKKAGVTETEDRKKIMSASKEIQVEETKFESLPTFSNVESSTDELFAFLLKLNRQCTLITHTVEAVNNQIPLNPQKVVLEWDSTQNISSVCEDLVANVGNLSKEMFRLCDMLHKFQNNQKSNLCRVPPLEEQQSWRWSRFLKRTTLTMFGVGFVISIVSVFVRRNATQ
ncbi:ankyrin repeat, SAM and basic leucine zipper domain-containing protein 1 [Aquarana catesbeiana]|uniref:ankyrin repeat, SAM and basic leucine zipper domain-containing protein 1 n=1 Tax=Aquarana catesbeiana TaxID=8400 RepID=UPI003CC98D5F